MIPMRLNDLSRVAAVFVAVAAATPCQAQTLDKISIVIFSAPSLGAFMPPVIKAKKLDQANGLDITFQERVAGAAAAEPAAVYGPELEGFDYPFTVQRFNFPSQGHSLSMV